TERNIRFSLATGYLPVKLAANDIAKIEEIAKTVADDGTTAKMMGGIPVAIETVKENELYTNQAFPNGSKARRVLEYSLSDYLAKDLEAVNALVAAGLSRPEAAAHFATEENFESWYGEFTAALQSAIG
ncbi:MAG: ABC transporter substrate-binding protein, partial [Oscillibacter sp.]